MAVSTTEANVRSLPERVAQRRRRIATLVGVSAFFVLGVGVLVLWGLRTGPQPMSAVLRAQQEIKPGTRVNAGELGVTYLYLQDPSVISMLARADQRSNLIGQVATVDVPAGGLVPADVAVSQASAEMWKADVPVKRMPADLAAGDHVAVLVEGTNSSGQDVDAVVMQNVVVLDVHSGTADLWLPARAAPQIEWYADHGGVVLLTMKPGVTVSPLPVGGAS